MKLVSIVISYYVCIKMSWKRFVIMNIQQHFRYEGNAFLWEQRRLFPDLTIPQLANASIYIKIKMSELTVVDCLVCHAKRLQSKVYTDVQNYKYDVCKCTVTAACRVCTVTSKLKIAFNICYIQHYKTHSYRSLDTYIVENS